MPIFVHFKHVFHKKLAKKKKSFPQNQIFMMRAVMRNRLIFLSGLNYGIYITRYIMKVMTDKEDLGITMALPSAVTAYVIHHITVYFNKTLFFKVIQSI